MVVVERVAGATLKAQVGRATQSSALMVNVTNKSMGKSHRVSLLFVSNFICFHLLDVVGCGGGNGNNNNKISENMSTLERPFSTSQAKAPLSTRLAYACPGRLLATNNLAGPVRRRWWWCNRRAHTFASSTTFPLTSTSLLTTLFN